MHNAFPFFSRGMLRSFFYFTSFFLVIQTFFTVKRQSVRSISRIATFSVRVEMDQSLVATTVVGCSDTSGPKDRDLDAMAGRWGEVRW